MAIKNLKIRLLENTPFLKENGKFDLNKALMFSGQVGGICYNPDGLMASFSEEPEKTAKRIHNMAEGGHQSVFEHVNVGMYIEDAPKILNMVLNNEGEYSTSERSLRYTPIKQGESNITDREVELYDKWYNIIKELIEKKHGNDFKPFKIRTLAQENARYMTSVFINTEMVHTIPFVQLNRIITYMDKYEREEPSSQFKTELVKSFHQFKDECDKNDLLFTEFSTNPKNRSLRLFGHDLSKRFYKDEFGENYSTTYTASFTSLAQSQRHRTIHHEMEVGNDNRYGYFVPEILKGEADEHGNSLEAEWLKDIDSVKNIYPQGQKVVIHESGTMDDFILKMKERECSAAQFEIWKQTEQTRAEYLESLERNKHPRAEEFKQYTKTMRCGFPTYKCPTPCSRANKERDI